MKSVSFISRWSLLFLLLTVTAQAQWTTNGNCSNQGNGDYQLTPNSSHRKGSAWNNTQLDLSQPFDLWFGVSLGDNDGGADGISFTIQNSSYGLTALGDDGTNLAYSFASLIPPPISPAVNIEVDTYDNGAALDDIPDDHITVARDGNQLSLLAAAVPALGFGINVEDGLWHTLEIVWDPATITLQVYFDCNLRQTVVYDLVNSIFGGNPLAYYGFTGSTGQLKNTQHFRDLVIDAGPDTSLCAGTSVTLPANSNLDSLQWSPATGLSCTTCMNPVASPDSTTTYYLTGMINCKTFTDSVTVTVTHISTSTAVGICQGQTYFCGGALQSVSGVYVDTFTTGGGCDSIVTTTLTVAPILTININTSICTGEQYFAGNAWQTVSGIYYDTLVSSAGCDSVIITQLTVDTLPAVSLGNDTSFCEGGLLTLDAGPGDVTYLWQDGSAAQFYGTTTGGTFQVTVTNSFGCSASDSMALTVFPLPENLVVHDTLICGSMPLTITAYPFASYLWFDGSTSASHTFTDTGTYTLQATDVNGCSASDTLTIKQGCTEDLLVPNAFTPDGDGLNDIFIPILVNNISDYDMKIFNRWGAVIFESRDVTQGWNGLYRQRPEEMGTYVWLITYSDLTGVHRRLEGSLTLLL